MISDTRVTGTSRKNLDICAMIQLWARSKRKDGRFPADVLNFHGYSTDLKADPASGRTPEQNNMQQGWRARAAWPACRWHRTRMRHVGV